MDFRPARSLRFGALACLLGVLPCGLAQAQNNDGLGLDLTDDAAKTPAKPATPPPPDPDLATPRDAPDAKKDKLDVGEHDVSLEDRVKSVQRKGFNKKHHLELAPHFALTINDAFLQKYEIGGAAIYHFSDNLAFGARFDYMLVQTTANVATAKRALKSRLPTSKPKYGAGADFYWTPIYGKASLFNSIVHFDFFAIAGAGVVVSQTSSYSGTDINLQAAPLLNQGPHPAFDIGIGQRYALNEVITFHWQLLETLYTDTPGGSGASQVQRIMGLGVGLSFFIPPVRGE